LDELLLDYVEIVGRGDPYLQKHLPENPICLFSEDRREDDGNAIVRSLDIYRLLVAIVDLHQLALCCTG